MEEMSRTFKEAFSLSEYNPKQAIELYSKEIKVNPTNFPAWHNRGLCKLKIAIKERDKELLEDSKIDFRTAIELAAQDGKGFQIAEDNLKWAESTNFE